MKMRQCLFRVLILGCCVGPSRPFLLAKPSLVSSSTLQFQSPVAKRTIHWRDEIMASPTVACKSTKSDDSDASSLTTGLGIFVGIPAASLLLSGLLQAKLFAVLLVAKRVYIYLLAACVVYVAANRGVKDDPALGTRLIDLTREVLPDSSSLLESTMDGTDDTRFQEMAVLDNVDDSTQAVGLPLLVASSLVTSLFFVLLQNSSDLAPSDSLSSFDSLLQTTKAVIPNLTTLSNGAVLSLFARAELERITFIKDGAPWLSSFIALGLSAMAFLGPSALVWPIQNVVCFCLAVAVARAIQLPRMPIALVALLGLVCYDVVSVGIQLMNLGSETLAATAGSSVAEGTSKAASSAMGAVAMSKVTSSWQPGLFQVRLRDVTTDLLGLGDAVFPSILSILCARIDEATSNDSSNLLVASLFGFVAGCAACEFVPGIQTSGLPALLFLVPSMVLSVFATALLQGNISDVWQFRADSDDD